MQSLQGLDSGCSLVQGLLVPRKADALQKTHFPVIFIFTRKKVLQELAEPVSHKYLKIMCWTPLKRTCLI